MAEQTEREAVIGHFVDNKIHAETVVDLAIELQRDKQGRQEMIGSRNYIDRTLNAGYKSQAMADLLKDIKAANTNKPELNKK